MTTTIAGVIGRRVWDSRGRPTVEAEIALARRRRRPGDRPGRRLDGHAARRSTCATAARALAASTCSGAVAAVNGEIAAALVGRDVADQAGIDQRLIALDGTPDKSPARRQCHRRGLDGRRCTPRPPPPGCRSGAISPATGAAHPAAGDPDLRRRRPCRPPHRHPGFHGRVPGGATASPRRSTSTAEVYLAAGALMAEAGRLAGVADEGGWWPAFDTNEAGARHAGPRHRAGRLSAGP